MVRTQVSLSYFRKLISKLNECFWFEAYASFSTEPAYNDCYMSIYNYSFTFLPAIIVGVFDQDVSDALCLKHPGVRNELFSWARILGWIANAIMSSAIIFFVASKAVTPQAFREDGRVADFSELAVTIVNCQMALSISYLTWLQHLAIWGSIAPHNRVLVESCGPSPMYWLTALIVVLACLLPYITLRAYHAPAAPHVP